MFRDTTVQTLTLQPSVHEGVIVYEDSPLVRAVKHGHVLIVDEADKAPTNVTCILKTLVESGEMHLADGRRIVSGMLAHDYVLQDLCEINSCNKCIYYYKFNCASACTKTYRKYYIFCIVHFCAIYFGTPSNAQNVAVCFNK